MRHLTVLAVDDHEGLYDGDTLVRQEHRIRTFDLIEAAAGEPFTLAHHFCDGRLQDYVWEEGTLPVTLSEAMELTDD